MEMQCNDQGKYMGCKVRLVEEGNNGWWIVKVTQGKDGDDLDGPFFRCHSFIWPIEAASPSGLAPVTAQIVTAHIISAVAVESSSAGDATQINVPTTEITQHTGLISTAQSPVPPYLGDS